MAPSLHLQVPKFENHFYILLNSSKNKFLFKDVTSITKPNLKPTHPFNSSLCIHLSQSICVHWIIIIDSIHNYNHKSLTILYKENQNKHENFQKNKCLEKLDFSPFTDNFRIYFKTAPISWRFFLSWRKFPQSQKSQSNQDAAATKLQNNIPQIQKHMLRKKKNKNKKQKQRKNKTNKKQKLKKKKHEL